MMITIQGWIYIGLALFALTGWGYGYYESTQYSLFKSKIETEAVLAKDHADRTDAWNNKVIKETNDAYQRRLADINTKYGSLHYAGGSPMSASTTGQNSSLPTGETPHNLPLECAVTTNMLVTLQDIIKTTKDSNEK